MLNSRSRVSNGNTRSRRSGLGQSFFLNEEPMTLKTMQSNSANSSSLDTSEPVEAFTLTPTLADIIFTIIKNNSPTDIGIREVLSYSLFGDCISIKTIKCNQILTQNDLQALQRSINNTDVIDLSEARYTQNRKIFRILGVINEKSSVKVVLAHRCNLTGARFRKRFGEITKELEVLDISDNKISAVKWGGLIRIDIEPPIKVLFSLLKPKVLSIANNKIGDRGIITIANEILKLSDDSKEIYYLDLSNTGMTDKSFQKLAEAIINKGLPLMHLDISNNNLTNCSDAILKRLCETLPNMMSVKLERTNIGYDCITKLQEITDQHLTENSTRFNTLIKDQEVAARLTSVAKRQQEQQRKVDEVTLEAKKAKERVEKSKELASIPGDFEYMEEMHKINNTELLSNYYHGCVNTIIEGVLLVVKLGVNTNFGSRALTTSAKLTNILENRLIKKVTDNVPLLGEFTGDLADSAQDKLSEKATKNIKTIKNKEDLIRYLVRKSLLRPVIINFIEGNYSPSDIKYIEKDLKKDVTSGLFKEIDAEEPINQQKINLLARILVKTLNSETSISNKIATKEDGERILDSIEKELVEQIGRIQVRRVRMQEKDQLTKKLDNIFKRKEPKITIANEIPEQSVLQPKATTLLITRVKQVLSI